MTDARFEDASENPLSLKARDEDDLNVISSLVQDAVFPITEVKWESRGRRFSVLLNRFRWERGAPADRHPERVQSVLTFDDVLAVASQGIDPRDRDTVLSLLCITCEPGEDGMARLTLVLAGDGDIRLDVECIEATLRDVTRPYLAPSRAAPRHPETD